MTYMLRDRPDGQIEIVVTQPTVVGVFAEREVAERVCVFLQEDENHGKVDDQPANFAKATADVAEAEAEIMAEVASVAPVAGGGVPSFLRPQARQERRKSTRLPVEVDEPTKTVQLVVTRPKHLTEEQTEQAFSRLTAGEKLNDVAPDFGLTMHQLRGIWANHKRQLQKHLAEGGQVACAFCSKPFTPSIASPDKCARCSHD